MEQVILVIHVLLAVSMIGFILLQRSEGGGLGMGGGSGAGLGGMMTARGTGNFLTRTTAILATAFFATSLLLAIIASSSDNKSIVEKIQTSEQTSVSADVDESAPTDADTSGTVNQGDAPTAPAAPVRE